MKPDNPRPVSLEDLLRLKRAERPPQEFWDRFERELRAKQLAAIVEKRPWWRVVPRAVRSFARLHLPLGATAALAFTIVVLRDAAPSASTPSIEQPAAAPTMPALALAPVEAAPADLGASSLPVVAEIDHEVSPEPVYAAAEPAPTPTYARADEILQVIAMIPSTERSDEPASAKRQAIAINLEPGQLEVPDLVNAINGTRGFESRVMPARTIEPLAQIPTPHEAKRARYLESALPNGLGYETLIPRSSERLTRIDDRRLLEEDSISRFGARADRVMFSF